MNREEFSFPILSLQEISSTLSELEIPLTPEELKKITSEKVIKTYEMIIAIFVPLKTTLGQDALLQGIQGV